MASTTTHDGMESSLSLPAVKVPPLVLHQQTERLPLPTAAEWTRPVRTQTRSDQSARMYAAFWRSLPTAGGDQAGRRRQMASV